MAVRLLGQAKLWTKGRGLITGSGFSSVFDSPIKPQIQQENSFSTKKRSCGGRHVVTMIPGVGIGPECMRYVMEVFCVANVPVDFEVVEINTENEEQAQKDLENIIKAIKRNGVAIKGNIETGCEEPHIPSRNVVIRKRLDMFAFIMECRSFPAIKTRHKNLDIVIVRQNTEGEYQMLEHESVPGVVEALKIITVQNTERIAHVAFKYAVLNGRKKVTAIHKANIMKLADGLFLKVAKRISKDYPSIQFEDMIVDNCSMQLVSKPEQFDVMLLPNLYGTIMGNILCGLIGSAGLLSARNYSHDYAVFEPGARFRGMSLEGKNVANPVAMINASVDLLRHLGLHEHAELIHCAVLKTINEDKVFTRDIGGKASSVEMVESIMCNIDAAMCRKNK